MKLYFLLLNQVNNFPPPPTPPPPGFPVDNELYLIGFALISFYLAYVKIKKSKME